MATTCRKSNPVLLIPMEAITQELVLGQTVKATLDPAILAAAAIATTSEDLVTTARLEAQAIQVLVAVARRDLQANPVLAPLYLMSAHTLMMTAPILMG